MDGPAVCAGRVGGPRASVDECRVPSTPASIRASTVGSNCVAGGATRTKYTEGKRGCQKLHQLGGAWAVQALCGPPAHERWAVSGPPPVVSSCAASSCPNRGTEEDPPRRWSLGRGKGHHEIFMTALRTCGARCARLRLRFRNQSMGAACYFLRLGSFSRPHHAAFPLYAKRRHCAGFPGHCGPP